LFPFLSFVLKRSDKFRLKQDEIPKHIVFKKAVVNFYHGIILNKKALNLILPQKNQKK
jgi:hypothetical protein